VLAGILIGLAVATKFYPVFLLGPLFLLCLRAGRLRAFWVTAGSAAGAWLAVNLPVAIAAPGGWSTFYRFNASRGADWGSIWYISEKIFTWNLGTPSLNLYEAGAIAIAFLGVCWLALAAGRRPRLPQLCFLTLALFLVFNKVYSPQYVLWLLPFAVLARPRWRAFLLWQAAEIVYFLAIWMYLLDAPSGRPGKGLAWQPYAVAVGIRDVAVLALCALVVIDILHPEGDIVRADGSDDPSGGVLDGAPDVFDGEPSYDEPEPVMALN